MNPLPSAPSRVPMHANFAQWRDWGQALLDLHMGYEKAKPVKFTRSDAPVALLARAVTVSLETMKITEAMRARDRGGRP